DGSVAILQEGSVPKFVGKVRSISFSGESAVRNGQRVLYVTERCVFELTEKGMKIAEVYPGIDLQKDILDRLPAEFAAELEKNM
ncbi:MAG: propionate CoA-transferase, partial [Lachnospiraceae bacterium]|nr:propionate CoA-transferase [Lachnospiraceae bacterium]